MAPILSNLYTKENTSPSLFDHSIDYSLGFEPAECSYIEISPDPNGTSTIREGFLYPDQVEEWLFPGLSVPGSPDGKHAQTAKEDTPMGQLRLLLSISETSNADKTVIMPWSQTTFEHICQKLSAPEHIVDILTHNTPHVAQLPVEHRVNGKDAVMSNAYLFKVGIGASGFYTILLTYRMDTATTYAIILAQSEVFDFEGLLTLLRRNSRLAPQPMFVPVMLMHLLLIMTMTRMQHQGQRLDHIQYSLGQHTYSSKPREDPFRADFETITPALNGTARNLSMMKMRTQARQMLLNKCLTYIEITARSATPNIKTLLDQSHDTILQHLEMTRNSNQNLLLQMAFEQRRIQIQLAVIYNFAQQKSNQIAIALTYDSTRIAENSRQDAAAMKTIALLTMAFLPGTFIAALFTTPFFDWNVPKHQSVIKDRFWCYWVTTVPLTLTVLLTWILWQQWHGRMLKRQPTENNDILKKTV